jgi:MEMO1 family protein
LKNDFKDIVMKVRHPAWAGQFYPESASVLRQEIATFLSIAPSIDVESRIVGLVSPHAGYLYSGQTAATAFKQIKGNSYKAVVVIAPSHAVSINGVSAYDGDFYDTPLGRIPVDVDSIRLLADFDDLVHISGEGHEPVNDRAEHSLEVQLPLLQSVIDGFLLVPLVFQDYSWENCRKLGEAIAAVFDPKDVLIVASTDLYHGYSQEECIASDKVTLNALENESAIDFCYGANNDKYMACGAGPVTALKVVGEKWDLQSPKVIAQTNSADVTSAKSGYVVGYAAALLEKKEKEE